MPLGDQCQLRLKFLDRYVLFLQDFEEAQDCFTTSTELTSQFVYLGLRGCSCRLKIQRDFIGTGTSDVIVDYRGAATVGLTIPVPCAT